MFQVDKIYTTMHVYYEVKMSIKCDFRSLFAHIIIIMLSSIISILIDASLCNVKPFLWLNYYGVMWCDFHLQYFYRVVYLSAQMLNRAGMTEIQWDWYCMSFVIYIYLFTHSENYYCIYFSPSHLLHYGYFNGYLYI